ncbi:hypothetical protein [Larkinella sp.]|uniref:hypothetical protein n=1 Tax=Larkinella sp. TaxID=2034517 RepID=UPI003BAB3007
MIYHKTRTSNASFRLLNFLFLIRWSSFRSFSSFRRLGLSPLLEYSVNEFRDQFIPLTTGGMV